MGLPQRVYSKPPLPPGAERRRSERFELLAQVELRIGGEVMVLPVVNISAGGMLLRVEDGAVENIGVDQQVTIFLDAYDISLTMDATVVRVIATDGKPTSIAVMWTATTSIGLAQLGKLLDHLRYAQ